MLRQVPDRSSQSPDLSPTAAKYQHTQRLTPPAALGRMRVGRFPPIAPALLLAPRLPDASPRIRWHAEFHLMPPASVTVHKRLTEHMLAPTGRLMHSRSNALTLKFARIISPVPSGIGRWRGLFNRSIVNYAASRVCSDASHPAKAADGAADGGAFTLTFIDAAQT